MDRPKPTGIGRHNPKGCTRTEKAACREGSQSQTSSRILKAFVQQTCFDFCQRIPGVSIEDCVNGDDCSGDTSLNK